MFRNDKKVKLYNAFVIIFSLFIIALGLYAFVIKQWHMANLSYQPFLVKTILILNFVLIIFIYIDGLKNFINTIIYYLAYARGQKKHQMKLINL